MSNPKRTSTVDIGVLNPPQARSGATKRKYDPIEDKEGLLNIMWEAARKETYDTTSRAVDSGIFKAWIMRVDSCAGGIISVKARIPELDSTIPEPAECAPPQVKTASHVAIEMHRTYISLVDDMPTVPNIGDVIYVDFPMYTPKFVDGRIIGNTGTRVHPNIKSSIPKNGGAGAAANEPARDNAEFGTPTGDAVGSGEKNPASQVPTPAEEDLSGADSFSQTDAYLEECGGDADCAADLAVADVKAQRDLYSVKDTEIGASDTSAHDAAAAGSFGLQQN